MKTTKDIAELFSAEIERIAKGEVRQDVILGLERCSNSLIKLARLEMDFAWKNWENQQPNVPWLSTKSKDAPMQIEVAREPAPSPRSRNHEPQVMPDDQPQRGTVSNRVIDLEREIVAADKELRAPGTSNSRKLILQDKIQQWKDRITFLQKTASKAA